MDLINWSLNAIDNPSSRREARVRGNLTALTERSQLATRWTRGTGGVSCVLAALPWRTLKISTYLVTGLLADWIRLALVIVEFRKREQLFKASQGCPS